jgi:hypothetical protein
MSPLEIVAGVLAVVVAAGSIIQTELKVRRSRKRFREAMKKMKMPPDPRVAPDPELEQ